METASDTRIADALSAIGQYLSDLIAPVQAVESVSVLLNEPAQLMASEIIGWIAAQNQGGKSDASVADYLFHAVSKLRYLVHLQLIGENDMVPYLESLKKLLMDHCPPQDRGLLRENFNRLGEYGASESAPVSYIHRLTKSSGSGAQTSEESMPEHSLRSRISILKDRLAGIRKAAPLADGKGGEELIPLLIASAASDVRDGEEFRELQEDLHSLGINSATDEIFRLLGDSLPGWTIACSGADTIKSRNPAIKAMYRIIYLAEDRRESSKRFQDMVQAAVEQFNTGSLARAATMFDLALHMISDEKLDPGFVAELRKTGHQSLDLNRLRSLAKKQYKHRLLRRVLNFFEIFTVESLLDDLKREEKRERRRLLLDLLIAHGETARKTALERLREIASTTNLATDWYLARNLVYILNEIPRSTDDSVQEETKLIAPLLRLSLSASLIKEVIRFAGQTKCSEAEELLIFTADKLEKVILEKASAGKDPAQKLLLLDRTIFALAHYGTQKASERVVRHGMSCREELGDTVSRLAYLSSRDLTADKESLALLIQFLKSKWPRKLLGLTISKNEHILTCIVKALSSTRAPVVREMFEHMATKFPDTKFGQAAADALREFDASAKPEAAAAHLLTGDLELFALPDLLQQLSQLQVAGTLTLKDMEGNRIGTLSLLAGRMRDCNVGFLEGKEAIYQLLEKPIAGTFVFEGRKSSGIQEQDEGKGCLDLESVVTEGMRRYDELQRARAIVPDFSLLRRSDSGAAPRFGEEEADLFNLIWPKTADVTSPEECEAVCRSDSYRVRTLLARWVEEGALVIE